MRIGVSELKAGQTFTAQYAGEERRVEVYAIFRGPQLGVLPEGVQDTEGNYESWPLDEVTVRLESGRDFDPNADLFEDLLTMGVVTLVHAADEIGGEVISIDDSTLVYRNDEGDECEVPLGTLSEVEVVESGVTDAEPDGGSGEDDESER